MSILTPLNDNRIEVILFTPGQAPKNCLVAEGSTVDQFTKEELVQKASHYKFVVRSADGSSTPSTPNQALQQGDQVCAVPTNQKAG